MRLIVFIFTIILVSNMLVARPISFSEEQLKTLTEFLNKKYPAQTYAHPQSLFPYQKDTSITTISLFTAKKPTVDAYYIFDGKTLFLYFKFLDQYESFKMKFTDTFGALRDDGHEKLASIGYHKPDIIFTYIAYQDYIKQHMHDELEYFYRAFYPKLPHPGITPKSADPEKQKLCNDIVAFLDNYDYVLYASTAADVKKAADGKLK